MTPGGARDEAEPNAEWLTRFSAMQWIRAAVKELSQAEAASRARDERAVSVGARRAAGMALNGPLRARPDPSWGRSYVEHLAALAEDESAPEAVRRAARILSSTTLPGAPKLVPLARAMTAPVGERELEAARDVMAHAYALVVRAGAADE